ncbi:hypothetical protein [Pseudoalteromonas sp. MEBiC 03485]|uniref:hypothetical protein n=1 Tax=Pseudoalteromonas sp. MEBiC 03485 TaxID=2571103 RepID=UPI00101E8F37|nr:hypothetical protein [Pseudoalteromonas sp. MEBiC 03485]RZD22222.1 hypothetical protein EVU92_09200 [Pseudoalteromonas sp. MEBiC 03485]
MITSEGVIGKVVTFIVSKTVGKLVDLPFDKRKKACRSLTKLYYCVQTLDDVTEEFYQTLEDFDDWGDAKAMINALNNNASKLEQASNMFIELGQELRGGLEIIDPVLANCCNALYISKSDFLSFMSNSIEFDRTNEVATIKVKTPSDEMLNVDLNKKYDETKIAFAENDITYWPSSALDDFYEEVSMVTISFDDMQSAQRLKTHIDKHRKLLGSAKVSLRELLKDNFSIEEVLFQNDSHPWR